MLVSESAPAIATPAPTPNRAFMGFGADTSATSCCRCCSRTCGAERHAATQGEEHIAVGRRIVDLRAQRTMVRPRCRHEPTRVPRRRNSSALNTNFFNDFGAERPRACFCVRRARGDSSVSLDQPSFSLCSSVGQSFGSHRFMAHDLVPARPESQRADAVGHLARGQVVPATDREPEEESVQIGRYVSALMRYKWLILLIMTVGTVASVAATRFVHPKYQSQATIWIASETPQGRSVGPFRAEELV